MHYVQTSFHNVLQPHETSSISTELSLISNTFQPKTKTKTKNSSASRTTTNPKKKSFNNKNKNKNQECWNCSTSLELYNNPWKIKKVLTKSDIGRLNRLLFGANVLENLMLPVLGADARRDATTGTGTLLRVWDVDTMTMHKLVLKRWASFNNFVLIGGWNRDFVKRRGLNTGDEIGLLWDSYAHCFHFSLLKRSTSVIT